MDEGGELVGDVLGSFAGSAWCVEEEEEAKAGAKGPERLCSEEVDQEEAEGEGDDEDGACKDEGLAEELGATGGDAFLEGVGSAFES